MRDKMRAGAAFSLSLHDARRSEPLAGGSLAIPAGLKISLKSSNLLARASASAEALKGHAWGTRKCVTRTAEARSLLIWRASKEIKGANGKFCVGDFNTPLGEFKVKEPILDQFEQVATKASSSSSVFTWARIFGAADRPPTSARESRKSSSTQ